MLWRLQIPLNYRVWGLPAILLRGIAGKALRASVSGVLPEMFGISSGKSRLCCGFFYWIALPFVQTTLQTEKTYCRINCACHSRYRYREIVFSKYFRFESGQTVKIWDPRFSLENTKWCLKIPPPQKSRKITIWPTPGLSWKLPKNYQKITKGVLV